MAETSSGGGSTGRKRRRNDAKERKLTNKDANFFTIKCALGSILKEKDLKLVIDEQVQRMSQISYEAAKLLNLHVLRLLESKQPIPKFDQTFIVRALQLCSTMSLGRKSKDTTDKTELQMTFDAFYKTVRPTTMAWTSRDNITTPLGCYSARDYLTNIENHVMTNLFARHRKWLSWKVSVATENDSIPAKERWNLVTQLIDVTLKGEERDFGDHSSWANVLIRHARRFIKPHLLPVTDDKLKEHWNEYLPWLHFLLQEFEQAQSQQQPQPARSKVPKPFVVLPQKAFGAQFMTIDYRHLKSMYMQAFTRKTIKDICAKDKKQALWGDAFKLNKLTTKNHQFSYTMIKTDGVSACVTMKRPGKKAPKKKKGKRQKRGTESVAVTERKVTLPERARVLAIDPGRGDIFTAYEPGPEGNGRGKFVSYSNGRYRHEAKFIYAQKKRQLWTNQCDGLLSIQDMQNTLQTAKVSSASAFQRHLESVFPHLATLQKFYGATKMKRLNLKTYIGKQKTIEKMCQTVTNGNKDTIVAYGDAGFSSTSKGQAPGPHQHFKRRLAQYCKVIPVNEDYTSQMCSNCDSADKMKGIRVPTGEGNQHRHELFKIRVCNHCRIVWNRDVNAARNIYNVFMAELVNGQRPPRFSRKPQSLQVNESAAPVAVPIALQGPLSQVL